MRRSYIGLLSVCLFATVASACGSQMSEEEILARATEIHSQLITIDTHVDISSDFATPEDDPGIRGDRKVDLPKMREGGLDAAFFAVYVGQNERTTENYQQVKADAMVKFDAIHRMAEEMYPDQIEIPYTADDMVRIHEAGKLAACIGIENGYAIGQDISLLETYHGLGARYMTLTHNGHNDIADLDKVLEKAESHEPPYRRILIITDGVFSMDGDIAPLDEIAKRAEEHGAMLYVDDAHGEGVLGEDGRGIVSHFKLDHRRVHVEMGTFSKAYGTIGGHISGSNDLVRFAWNKSRTWLLSSSQPPPVAAATIAAIDVLETEPHHVQNLWRNTNYFKSAVQDLGFDTGKSQTPIIPVIVGESSKAKELSNKLYDNDVFVVPIVYPMVSRDQARIRAQMHAQLTIEELDKVIEVVERIGKDLEII